MNKEIKKVWAIKIIPIVKGWFKIINNKVFKIKVMKIKNCRIFRK